MFTARRDKPSDASAFSESKGLGRQDAEDVIPRSRVKSLAEKYDFGRQGSRDEVNKADLTRANVSFEEDDDDDDDYYPYSCFGGLYCFDFHYKEAPRRAAPDDTAKEIN